MPAFVRAAQPVGLPVSLTVHPTTPGPAGMTVSARLLPAEVADSPGWWLHYSIEGPTDALAVPAPTAAGPADGLWRHTCFEAFVQDRDGPGYREFNFSPSGQWAVYRFTAERERLTNDPPPTVGPQTEVERSAHCLQLRAWIPQALLPARPGAVGLTAVIEAADESLSYWALRHPHADRPDFHHPAGRTLLPLAGPVSSSHLSA